MSDRLCENCSCKLAKNEKKKCKKCALEAIGPVTIVSEVLVYAKHHRHAATKDNISKVMAAFFHIDELKEAKDKLWDSFSEVGVLGEKQNRRGSSNRSEHMAICDDIQESLAKLEDEDIDFNCYASKWDRIPKSSPEVVNNVILSERLAAVEAMLKVHSQNLSEMRTDVLKHEATLVKVEETNDTQGKLIEELAKQNSCHSDPAEARVDIPGSDSADSIISSEGENAVPSSSGVHIEDDVSGNLPAVEVDDVRAMSPLLRGGARSQADRVRNVIQNDSGGNSRSYASIASNNAEDNSFQRPAHQLRREKKQQNRFQKQSASNGRDSNRLVGTSSSDGLSAAPSPSRDFFVWRVHKSVTVDKMSDYIKKKGVHCRDLVKTSHRDSVNASFKLSVALDDVSKIFTAAFWPKGINVRKWKIRVDERNNDFNNQ